jgi:hypothetical protein
MMFAGRKQFGRALELLLQALTAPAVAGNAIVVASFKKLVLISLIHYGRNYTEDSLTWDSDKDPVILVGNLVQLPKFTPSRVKAIVESESKAYLELANSYGTHNADRLKRCMEQFSATFKAVRVVFVVMVLLVLTPISGTGHQHGPSKTMCWQPHQAKYSATDTDIHDIVSGRHCQ